MSILPSKMYNRITTYFPNANVPATRDSTSKALTVARPDVVYTVPYILKLLAERPESVEALRSCSEVITVGSQCPDELGDRLVGYGINLCNWLGSTEVGVVGTSVGREPGDDDWAYLRIPQFKMRSIWPRYIAENQYEFIYLKDYPSRVESNSNDPPQSFHSKDIFTPHSTIPNAWKYLGRIDDRVTLTNGEKVLPLPIEGRIREQPLIREDIVFGVSKPMPGLLVFRSEEAKEMPDDEFIDHIWPDVEQANQNAESFSQIGKEMIIPLPADSEYPQADKGNFIRPRVYQAYEKEIEKAYSRLEQRQEGALRLDPPELEEYLLGLCSQLLGQEIESRDTDFFRAGMDSLRVIRMRDLIIKDLDLGGNGKDLSQNVVFESSNVRNLAQTLRNLREGQASQSDDPRIVMQRMIQEYGVFKRHSPGTKALPEKHTVVLTGATGGLGSQLLSKLCQLTSVPRIYCLVRGADPVTRLRASLENRHLDFQTSKVTVLTSDLGSQMLGLDDATYSEIRSSATHIVHAAWPVNFQLGLASFEADIQGLHNLLQLSLSSPYDVSAKLLFCSSVATALGTPAPAKVPEEIIEQLHHTTDMGYGRSKLVGEHIVAAAVESAGAQASILRIGQIVGDTKYGMWNDREAIPAVVRSALTMGILPELRHICEWLPVDILAECILELGGLGSNLNSDETRVTDGATTVNGDGKSEKSPMTGSQEDTEMSPKTDELVGKADGNRLQLVYNIKSPHTFSWGSDLLPALRAEGLSFDTVPTEEWLRQLHLLSSSTEDSSSPSSKGPAADPEKNPALKLSRYYISSYQRDQEDDGRLEFLMENSMRDSKSLRESGDVLKTGAEAEKGSGAERKEIGAAESPGEGPGGKARSVEEINGKEQSIEERRSEKEEDVYLETEGDSTDKGRSVNGDGCESRAGDWMVKGTGLEG
ncbi:MAG: hypothetical protein Q9219_002043 [cf. Caloplaca sp. 3 TL-2023]